MSELLNEEIAYISTEDESVYNKKIKSEPRNNPQTNIVDKDVVDEIVTSSSSLYDVNVSELNSFTSVSRRRDQIYEMLDTMCEDSTISAVLETYVEDATERNPEGNIVWCESDDSKVQSYVNFLLRTLDIDKHMYSWMYQLCKYGDCYIKLFHKSEVQEKDRTLNEDVKIKVNSPKDKYVHFVECMPNPAEMFELTKFGKTAGYIHAPINTVKKYSEDFPSTGFFNQSYRFQKNDVTLYKSTEFVHASLDNTDDRAPEKVSIFNDKQYDNDLDYSDEYSVRKGQSLLYDSYKIWREMQLLENAILLNRVTKSSIVRIVQLEVGDMPKERVIPKLNSLKSIIEQKTALNESVSMNEYNNPGPVDNIVYLTTRNGQGSIQTLNLGGDDTDIGSLNDLDYFKNKLFGSLRVPKEYFGNSENGAVFDSGKSLALISSRYAKTVKRLQHSLINALTDLIHIFLLDKGLVGYVGKFKLKMTSPTTQEELDRQEKESAKINQISDILNLVPDISDVGKLRITKSLLSTIITNPEVVDILEEEIESMSSENISQSDEPIEEPDEDGSDMVDLTDFNNETVSDLTSTAMGGDIEPERNSSEESIVEPETMLPDMSDLGIDFSDNNAETN